MTWHAISVGYAACAIVLTAVYHSSSRDHTVHTQSRGSRPLVHLVLLFIFNPDCPQLPKISKLTPNSFNPHHFLTPTMASLTSIGLPRTLTSSPEIPLKPHQYPQFRSLKQRRFPSQKRVFSRTAIKASNPSAPPDSSPGLYSAQKFELTARNVDLVLEDVRPYLIADGGNVDVVSVEDGVVSLKLQGGLALLLLYWFILI
jgi:hypothetical protein